MSFITDQIKKYPELTAEYNELGDLNNRKYFNF